jgi:hypothetical protein
MCLIVSIVWAVLCCIIGVIVIVRPEKIKNKINQASSAEIRVLGVVIFCTGAVFASAVVVINKALKLLNH